MGAVLMDIGKTTLSVLVTRVRVMILMETEMVMVETEPELYRLVFPSGDQ